MIEPLPLPECVIEGMKNDKPPALLVVPLPSCIKRFFLETDSKFHYTSLLGTLGQKAWKSWSGGFVTASNRILETGDLTLCRMSIYFNTNADDNTNDREEKHEKIL